jgi:poly(A) polymerase
MKIHVPDLMASRRSGTYLVGGCVRDLIQGRTPRDFDIAVSGDPRAFAEETATRLGGRVFVLGKDKFTVFCVTAHKVQIDIMAYKGSNIQDDLFNRDFTINALACRLADGRIIDVTGGLEDLHRRVIRMVSPKAFQDDPARLVRAFRMAASLNFSIEAETIKAIRTHSALLEQTAAERIWAEFRRILACPDSHSYILMMHDSNVLSTILPVVVEQNHNHRDHRHAADGRVHALGKVRSLEAILDQPEVFLPRRSARFIESVGEERRVLLKMAALLQNIGKTQCRRVVATGRVRYCGHAARGAELARAIGQRLRMSSRHREWIASLIRRHQRPLFLYRAGQGCQGPPPKAIGRFFRQCGEQAPHLLILSIAGIIGDQNATTPHPATMTRFLIDMLTFYVDRIHQGRCSPILNGRDLIQNFNLPPSPIFGVLLRRVDELHLAGMILNRKQALQWVEEQLRGSRKKKKNTPRPTGRGC